MRKLKTILTLVAVCLLAIGVVYAAEPGGASVQGETDLGEFNAPAAGTTDLTSGSITSATLETNQSTFRWTGLFGNTSGNIVLGDNTNTTLFEWAAAGNLVYASSGTPTWAALTDATEANVLGVNAYLTSGSDNYTMTFTGGSESIGSNIFTGGGTDSDFATTTSAGLTTWKTYSLWDTTSLVFAGKVVEDGTSYNNQVADFQMIIPEDGTGGDTSATTYNLWVELQ